MRIFSKQKEEKKLALVFDIGSSSVGAAVFELNKSGSPHIIVSLREPIAIKNKIDVDRFLLSTIASLELVVSRICMMGVGKPFKIFCVLSSVWYASQTRHIVLEKNVPFLFTSKLADELIQKEINIFEEEHLIKFSSADHKVRMIEFKNMKTMLNGYATSDPFNKKTKKLKMTVFVSMSENRILKKIEDTVFRHLHSRDVKFSSFAMATFMTTRDLFIDQENFLLADISGEVTDVSIVKKDILNNSISFPLGYNFMIRKVAEELGFTLSEAKSLFSLYKDGHAVDNVAKKLTPIIDKLKNEWIDEFRKSLFYLSDNISTPPTIFITVDQELVDFFSKIIKTEQFNQYSLADSEFKIVFLGRETLHGAVTFKGEINRDPFLSIESVYINRFFC